MKAAVCREFGKPLVIEEVNLADAGPGEVRVKIAAVAICHSDITYADGSCPRSSGTSAPVSSSESVKASPR
jgi:Zn-dependent alcohol dehydrogenase